MRASLANHGELRTRSVFSLMRCPFTDLPRTERQIQATSLLLTASDARYYGTLAALENGQGGRKIRAIS